MKNPAPMSRNQLFLPSRHALRLLASAAMAGGSVLLIAAAPPQANTCAACHGAAGLGDKAAGYPALAGQPARYLYWQLIDFQRGSRKSLIMQPIAKPLSKADISALAHYYASLPVPVAADKQSDGPGEDLAVDGARHQLAATPACNFCHGAGGTGSGPFPRLAGQPAAYLADQLKAWQRRTRPAGPLGLMGHVARQLSAQQIKEVSDYYAALSPHPPVSR
jgi:cytochrome c553